MTLQYYPVGVGLFVPINNSSRYCFVLPARILIYVNVSRRFFLRPRCAVITVSTIDFLFGDNLITSCMIHFWVAYELWPRILTANGNNERE